MSDLATANNEKESTSPRPPMPRKPRRKRRIILIAAILIVLGGGYLVWKRLSMYESTDDAQIDGHVNPISARISGHLIEVLVLDESHVQAGSVLVRIDPRDYEVAVAKAEADLADAEAALRSSLINVPITAANTASQLKTARSSLLDANAAVQGSQRQLDAARARLAAAEADVQQAEANYRKAIDDVERYRRLVEKDEISRQQYDTAFQTAEAAKATVDSRKAAVAEPGQNVRVAESAVEQASARVMQAEASIQAAMTAPEQVAATQHRAKSSAAQVAQRRADLEQAKLNLAYCTIRSPVTGIVGKKTAEVGQNVSPGQGLMAVVPLDDIWVTANFKETQLRNMRPGQRVKFSVDAYGREYGGRVEGVGGATGSRFSLLPPENATGNYVKVVQRIPVRIDINPGENRDHHLRVGMSVEPRVYLH